MTCNIKFKITDYMDLRREQNELMLKTRTETVKEGFITLVTFDDNKLTEAELKRLDEIDKELKKITTTRF